MKKVVAVAGVVKPRGLGDALQYYVTVKLLQKFYREVDVAFFCPGLKDGFFIFKDLNLNADLLDLGPVGGYHVLTQVLLDSLLHKGTFKHKRKSTDKVKTKKSNRLLRIIRALGEKYEKYMTPYAVDKYTNSFIMKSFSFDASIFGGHTISGSIYPYIYKYEAFHRATKGPMVTSPISISELALKHAEERLSRFKCIVMLKRLRRSVQKLSFIYTRGPYSLKILRDYLGIDESKIGMALDSGFGAKMVIPSTKPSTSREGLKILLIPRKDYFYIYKREHLYRSYLNSLAELILWLPTIFDLEVYLTSQTIDAKHNVMGGQAAVSDLLNVLKKRDKKHLRHLKYIEPECLADAARLCSSMDLVVTSYMHGGIMALGLGVPAFFILPLIDTKVLDILSFIGLDASPYLMDIFDVNLLETENFVNEIGRVVMSLSSYRDTLKCAIDRALPTMKLPIEKIIELSE